MVGHGRALVPRAAWAAFRRAGAGNAGGCRRRARTNPVRAGRHGARGFTAAAVGGGVGTSPQACHAHGACSRSGPRVVHDAPNRRVPARQRRAGRRPAAGRPSQPDVPARPRPPRGSRSAGAAHGHLLPEARGANAGTSDRVRKRRVAPRYIGRPAVLRPFGRRHAAPPSRGPTGSRGTRSRTAFRTCRTGSTATSTRSGRSSR